MTQAAWPSWINGEPGRLLPLSERGLQFGDGLFETMRAAGGRIPLWHFHQERLHSGLQRLGISVEPALLEQQLQQFLAAVPADSAVIKLLVTRGRSERGYAAAETGTPTLVLQSFPFSLPLFRSIEHGVSLALCTTRLGWNPQLAGIKHLNRLEQVLARQELAGRSVADGLMCDINGNVIEACAANIFWVSDGVVMTPDLSRCGVDGVMRRHVLQLLADWRMEVCIADFALSALEQAQEVFMTSSLLSCLPVSALDGQRWRVGELSRRIRQEVESHYAS